MQQMQIIIIGSGVAGMFAALRLAEAQSTHIDKITIIEKTDSPGGLIKVHSENGYFWDTGIFIFPEMNPLNEHCPELLDEILKTNQITFIKNKFYNLTQLIKDSARALSFLKKLHFAIDYTYSYIRTVLRLTEKNLFTWIRYRVTKLLYDDTQLEIYLKKLQGMPTKELSSLIGWERIDFIHHNTRPVYISRMLFGRPKKPKKPPIKRYYPFKRGVGVLSGKIADLCVNNGVVFEYNCNVKEISREESGSYSVTCRKGDADVKFESTHVISTMPLNNTVKIFKKPFSDNVIQSAESLKFMNLLIIHYMLDKHVEDQHYHIRYSFEPYHKWKRILFLPIEGNKCSMNIEITFVPGSITIDDKLFEEIEQQIIDDLQLFTKDQIIMKTSSVIPNAYPVYVNGFDKAVKSIRSELESDSFRLAGRQGRFCYINSNIAIAQGQEAADLILRDVEKQ